MPAIISDQFRIMNAETFIKSFVGVGNTTNTYYTFIGQPNALNSQANGSESWGEGLPPLDGFKEESEIKETITDNQYGYTNGIAYFLFEKIQFYQDNILLQEFSGDSLFAQRHLKGTYNSSFLEDPLTSQHLAGVAEVADRRGYAILVQSGRPNQIDEESLAPLLEGRFDGAIIQLSGKPKLRKKSAEMALSSGLPSVILDEVGLSPGQLGVRADQEQGAFEITQHLINLGHVRIGFIATAAPWAVIEQRYKGFQKAMRHAGIEVVPEHVLLEAVYMAIDGEQLALRLLQMKKPPTAFMCTSDLLAAGVMRAVRSLNLEIPRDIAVTGFDNFAFSQYLQPSLSTVKIPVYEMGQMAANMLINVIEGIELTKNLVVFRTEIIIRESS